LVEGSKRVVPSPRTISDLKYMSHKVFQSWKNKTDFQKLGEIHIQDSTGGYSDVPVYYWDELDDIARINQLPKTQHRNLSTLFLVINPNKMVNITEKTIYNSLYHEVQHLMDINVTHKLSNKKIGDYSTESDENYYGHDFEFRAYTNEFLNAIREEYVELSTTHTSEELNESLDSLLSFFGKGEYPNELTVNILYSISSETNNDDNDPTYINILSDLKQHNPNKWKHFLKMLYSTAQEIKNELN
jgi:hypothetical protein